MTRWLAIGEPKLEHLAPRVLEPQRTQLDLRQARRTLAAIELPEGRPLARLLPVGEGLLVVREPDPLGVVELLLLDASLVTLAELEGLRADWAVDEARGVLLGRTLEGSLAAWTLADLASPPVALSARFEGRELDALRIVEDLVVSATRKPRLLGAEPLDVVLDVHHIGDYQTRTRFASLKHARRIAERSTSGCSRVLVELDLSGIVVASEGELSWFDWTLRARAELAHEAEVVQLARRGDGRCWAQVDLDGQPELWLLSTGVIEQRIALDPDIAWPRARERGSLLVAPDGAAVLIASKRVACLDAGALRWVYERRGRACGVIDEQGTTVVGHDRGLVAFAGSGEAAAVWTDESERGIEAIACGPTRVWVGAGRWIRALG